MQTTHIRTDLAMEAKDSLTHTPDETSGIEVEEEKSSRLKKTIVRILTQNAANSIGKPKGTYVTLESPQLTEDDEASHLEISKALSLCLQDFCKIKPNYQSPVSILVVGLGNRNVTPDCLGPSVIDHLNISRHLFHEFGQSVFPDPVPYLISGIVPGVMAQTGMESLEIIQGIVSATKPSLCLVIDALAARSVKRLNRTIQISDTGIHPGSGVGNHRSGITEESLGIPVLSLGIPTVVDAATIVSDSLTQCAGEDMDLSPLLLPSLHTMYVTPKDIDASIHRRSHTVSTGINLAFGPKLT